MGAHDLIPRTDVAPQILAGRGTLGRLALLATWAVFVLRSGRALTRIPRHAAEDRLLLLGCALAAPAFLVPRVVCVVERTWSTMRQVLPRTHEPRVSRAGSIG